MRAVEPRGVAIAFGHRYAASHALVRGSAEERLHVAFIDINHRAHAFPSTLAELPSDHAALPCVRSFLDEVGWHVEQPAENQTDAFEAWRKAKPNRYDDKLEALLRRLDGNSCTMAAADRAALREMVEVAQRSHEVRQVWDTQGEHAAHPLREEVIKNLVDRRLADTTGPVVLNMGGFHLQKTHVMGTPKEWTGEHLAKPSHPACPSPTPTSGERRSPSATCSKSSSTSRRRCSMATSCSRRVTSTREPRHGCSQVSRTNP